VREVLDKFEFLNGFQTHTIERVSSVCGATPNAFFTRKTTADGWKGKDYLEDGKDPAAALAEP